MDDDFCFLALLTAAAMLSAAWTSVLVATE